MQKFMFLPIAAFLIAAPAWPDDNAKNPPTMGLLRDVGISADGKLAFAGDSNRVIWVWDVEKRKLLRAIQDTSKINQNTQPHFAFSADGKFAVVGNEEGISIGGNPETRLDAKTFTFWDLTKGVRLRAFELNGEPVYRVAISPDGKRALSVSLWKTVLPQGRDPNTLRWFEIKSILALRLWDTSTGKLVRTLLDDGPVGPIAFSPDSKYFSDVWVNPQARTEKNRAWALGKWDTKSGDVLGAKEMAITWSHLEIGSMALSAGGKHVVVGNYVGLSLWNVETGKLVWYHDNQVLRGGVRFDDWVVRSVAFSPDAKQILAAGYGGFLDGKPCDRRGGMVILDAAMGRRIPGFIGTTEWVGSVLFVPESKMLLGSTKHGLRLWDARSGGLVDTFKN